MRLSLQTSPRNGLHERMAQFGSAMGLVCVLLFKDPKGGKKFFFEWKIVFCGVLTGFAKIE